ncbi:MAG: type II 3-dehydroquinate dehydratase [Kiritimatiellia bacterium]
MKIMVIDGPNLNLLGKREPEIYGSESLREIHERIDTYADSKGIETVHFQSCIEGELVDAVCKAGEVCDGIIINPAAFTHSSVALRDAIAACGLPVIEVHLSNTHRRENFRHCSLTVSVCIGQIMGFGSRGYMLAIDALEDYINRGIHEK